MNKKFGFTNLDMWLTIFIMFNLNSNNGAKHYFAYILSC